MKTLDEVIKALEICIGYYCSNAEHDVCPYFGESDMGCMKEPEKDALHYLQEYRDYQDTMCALPDYYEWLHSADNPPLTWDELKQMEGKPVWVEILSDEIDLSSRWMMVARETKAHSLPLAYMDDIGHWIFGHEDKLGKTWQAYRKEKE